MADEAAMHWLVMLHQAQAFARYNPHDAIARIDALVREMDSAVASDASRSATTQPLREQARIARARYVAELERFRAACDERALAYRDRIRNEIGIR